MTDELDGKVALVTGAARGIGAATARALVAQGAAVALTDVLDDEGKTLARELSAEGKQAIYAHLDVSNEAQRADAVDRAVKHFGRLDILVTNAGIGTVEDVETETLEGYNRVIAINQTGTWLGMCAALPRLRQEGGGSIINLSSIFGAVGGFGGSVAYHASKGAVRLMTKNAAIRYAKEGIRVNSVRASSTLRCSPRSRAATWSRCSSPRPPSADSAGPRRSRASSPFWPATRRAT